MRIGILAKSGKQLNEMQREEITCYLMIMLPLLGFLIFSVYPIIWTFRWAFFSYNGIPSETVFIGFDNFKQMFTTDLDYWKAWVNTLYYVLLKVPFEMCFALFIAVLLQQKLKCKGLFRATYYLPCVISIAIVGLMFTNMFSINGFVNSILVKLNIIETNIDWFGNRHTATLMLALGGIWTGFGTNILYFLSALSNISPDLYEAADVDGANSWTKFSKITLPMISPVAVTVVLLSLIASLGSNEYVISFTNGAPGGQTRTVMSYLTTKFVPGFTTNSEPPIGYGCSLSLVTTILFASLSIIYNKINNKVNSIF